MALPPSGWYDSPDLRGKLRFWDGERWTEHVYSDEDGRQTSPIGLPPPPVGAGGVSEDRRPPGELVDIGTWIRATFRALGRRWRPLLKLAVPLVVVPTTLVLVGLYWAFSDVVVRNERFSGFNRDGIAFVVVAGLASILAAWVFGLAASHHLVGYFRQADPTLRHSLEAARRGLLRFLGWGLALIFAAVAVMFVSVLIIAAAPVIGILVIPGLIVLAFWAFVKVAFLGVSCVVAPRETNALAASAEVSEGRYWKVLGRLLLLGLLVAALSIATNFVTAPIQGNETTTVFVEDGVIEDVDFEDFFPSPPVVILLGLFSGVVTAAQGGVYASGIAHLYHQSGAPVVAELDAD